ncbi:hypothetical protein APSETT445_000526 [Aspergillus pseudonomiae]
MAFNVLTTNAVDLQQLLEENKTTSAQVVEEYLAQIDRYEPVLNALISPAPRDKVLKIAQARDEERQKGQIRGPFHGIPIILKDSFVTASELGMSTTAGSYAFIGAKASKNGAITQRLIDAGLIILGKANMTMLFICTDPKQAPGGSSTGSAVAVAAGFSPLAMATETIGSIVTPSTRAGLYALKPTTGVQDTTGLYTMTEFFDSPGPMAKSAADVRVLSGILLDRLFNSVHLGSWEGLSLGFLDPKEWSMSPDFCTQFEGTAEQMVDEYEETVSALRDGGCPLKYPIYCKDPSVLPNTTLPIAYWDFKNVCIPKFIRSFDECAVTSVADIVRFNKENSEKALPARSGYPVATVPIGQLRYNGRPFGLCLVARADEEGTLLQFMEVYEKVAKPRPVPKFE